MQTLVRKAIPVFYTAIAYTKEVTTARDQRGRVCRRRYLCLNCGTEFEVDIPRGTNIMANEWKDNCITCPICSKQHLDYTHTQHVGYCDFVDRQPIYMLLTVKELKDSIVLMIKERTAELSETKTTVDWLFEEFRYNIKRRKSTYRRWTKNTELVPLCEIGDPFDYHYAEQSPMRFIKNYNMSDRQRKDVQEILSVMRRAIRKKWKEIYGYDLGGLYTTCGPWRGRMLFPLHNFAFRLLFPESKNLPNWLSGSNTDIKVTCKNLHIVSGDWLFADLDDYRKGNGLKKICQMLHLPKTKLILRYLHDDLFCGDRLALLLSMLHDQNYLPKALELLDKIKKNTPTWVDKDAPIGRILQNLKDVAVGHTGKQVMNYLEYLAKNPNACEELRDTSLLLLSVTLEAKRKALSVKLKNMHDFLVEQKHLQDEKGYKLEVPEHIVRRLSMQMGLVKFFLPNTSKELKIGGEIFHNCVGTYSQRVKMGECQIAFMTNDNGKLIACLEIRGNRLVQAKLKFNHPVYQNGAINGAVLDWCEKTGLKVATQDVRKMRYPAIIETGKAAAV